MRKQTYIYHWRKVFFVLHHKDNFEEQIALSLFLTFRTLLIENNKIINLGIFLKSTKELIGYAGICNISDINKSGEYYIFIGEKKMWGKGIGKIVTEKILEIGFEEHELNRIFLTVSEPNIAGIKAYKNAGFKLEGKLRQACFRDNEYHDKIVMSVLQSEWKNL